jgi:hypothetical protein
VAGLLERLFSPLARAHASQTWPLLSVEEHWTRVEGYRRRVTNDAAEMLMHAPAFNATEYGAEIFTPVGVAQEVCNFSAEMLFSAEPSVTFEQDEDLLREVWEANGLAARLVAIAASVAAEGRGALRVIWDEEIADVPLITHVHEDRVIWDERHGAFVRGGIVVIERRPDENIYRGGNDLVYRLLEEHGRGYVSRRLYKGRAGMLGSQVPLSDLDEFAEFPEEEDTGLDVPTLVRWDNVSGGKSDIAGQEALLDRINTEYSHGAEKSEKSRPVSFADSTLFDDAGIARLSGIIPARRGALQSLDDDPSRMYGTIQPAFQSAETIAWIDYLVDSALMFMGYSKASYGRDQGGSADSGKALRLRQARTLLKKAGKDRMAKEALINALAISMAMADNASKVADYRPEIELGDGLPRDTVEDAQEANLWQSAEAISLEEKIRLRRPDWDNEAVDEEAERIRGEKPQSTVPQLPPLGNLDPLGGGDDADIPRDRER